MALAGYNPGTTPQRFVAVDPTNGNDIALPSKPTAASPDFSRAVGADTMLTPAVVTVGATATLLANARAGRSSIKIVQEGTTEVIIGPSNAQTTATGDILLGTRGSSHTYNYQGALYGVVGTGTQTVRVVEIY